MRIIHIQGYYYPQLGYQEAFLPRKHSQLGHEVYVVTSDRYDRRIYPENKHLLGNRIKGIGLFNEEGIKVWRLKTLFEMPHQIWIVGLEKKIQELKPDIVIMHGIVNFSAIRIARLKKKLGNFKLIYDDHMVFAASRSPFRILYPLFKRTYSHLIQETADGLVGVADMCKLFMHKTYGFPLERITVISLGADDELFQFDAAARREVRDKLAIQNDSILFIYTGKLIPDKGPHLLVEAAIKLMTEHSNINVLLLGSGGPSYLDKIKQDIKDSGFEHRFFWHDAVPNKELYKFYSAADVAVWPRESSLSIMEAMACKLPVIISDTSQVNERVGYGNGLTYSGNDTLELARQMEKLLDPDSRKRMGANGRKAVEDKLNWTLLARQYLELVS